MSKRYRLFCGDCMDVMRRLPANSIDAIVTDPPYGLSLLGKDWDTHKGNVGFEQWTASWAVEALRVIKPGGHALIFCGSRTYHRMICGVEDAGFDVRDCLMWLYSSGMPKGLDISKAVDKEQGATRSVIGTQRRSGSGHTKSASDFSRHWIRGHASVYDVTTPTTEIAQQYDGWNTTLKPGWEPVVLVRRPLSEKSVAANILRWGTGGINVGGCRVEDRWPANVLLSHSPDCIDHDSCVCASDCAVAMLEKQSEGASRFFYGSKATGKQRSTSSHPTIKSIDVMAYLVRLITPPNGIVLDPFMGTGPTIEAALREGFRAVGIDLSEEYVRDADERLSRRAGILKWLSDSSDGSNDGS